MTLVQCFVIYNNLILAIQCLKYSLLFYNQLGLFTNTSSALFCGGCDIDTTLFTKQFFSMCRGPNYDARFTLHLVMVVLL